MKTFRSFGVAALLLAGSFGVTSVASADNTSTNTATVEQTSVTTIRAGAQTATNTAAAQTNDQTATATSQGRHSSGSLIVQTGHNTQMQTAVNAQSNTQTNVQTAAVLQATSQSGQGDNESTQRARLSQDQDALVVAGRQMATNQAARQQNQQDAIARSQGRHSGGSAIIQTGHNTQRQAAVNHQMNTQTNVQAGNVTQLTCQSRSHTGC